MELERRAGSLPVSRLFLLDNGCERSALLPLEVLVWLTDLPGLAMLGCLCMLDCPGMLDCFPMLNCVPTLDCLRKLDCFGMLGSLATLGRRKSKGCMALSSKPSAGANVVRLLILPSLAVFCISDCSLADSGEDMALRPSWRLNLGSVY